MWWTASEADILGFNIYCKRNGRLVKLNRALIPSVFGGTASGHRYAWRDTNPPRARATYRLQAVGAGGSLSWVGTANVAGR